MLRDEILLMAGHKAAHHYGNWLGLCHRYLMGRLVFRSDMVKCAWDLLQMRGMLFVHCEGHSWVELTVHEKKELMDPGCKDSCAALWELMPPVEATKDGRLYIGPPLCLE